MREKCLAKEHNTMSPARTRTRAAQSGVERTNIKATTPVKFKIKKKNTNAAQDPSSSTITTDIGSYCI